MFRPSLGHPQALKENISKITYKFYVCMYLRTYVCMCIYVCMYVCMYIYMYYVCVYVRMYVCMYVHMYAQNRYNSTHSITIVPDVDGRSTPSSGRFIPGKATRCPLHSRLSGPQGRCGLERNIVPHAIRSPDRPFQPFLAKGRVFDSSTVHFDMYKETQHVQHEQKNVT